MDRIFLISSAAVGFAFGAVYAAVSKLVVQAAKAIVSAKQQAIEAERAMTASLKKNDSVSHKVKLPARIK